MEEVIGDDPPMTAPPDSFRTHDRAPSPLTPVQQPRQADVKLGGQRVIGIVVETLVRPEAIDLGRHGPRLFPQPSEFRDLHMPDLPARKLLRQGIEVELRVGPRSRHAADVYDQLDRVDPQQVHEFGNRSR